MGHLHKQMYSKNYTFEYQAKNSPLFSVKDMVNPSSSNVGSPIGNLLEFKKKKPQIKWVLALFIVTDIEIATNYSVLEMRNQLTNQYLHYYDICKKW